jgi:hypothetical protein
MKTSGRQCIRLTRFLLMLAMCLATFSSPARAAGTDQYQNPDTVYQQYDSQSVAAAGQTVCAGSTIPAGWTLVDFFRADNSSCSNSPFSRYYPWNVWVIEDLRNAPVGTTLTVCTDYNNKLPSDDWRVVKYDRSSAQCGHTQFVLYFNIATIERYKCTGCTPTPGNGGNFDSATCTALSGWAWDSTRPTTPINVDILGDGVVLATVGANQFRSDLQAAGIGDGRHGFNTPVPKALLNGAVRQVSVRISGTSFTLPGSPKAILCSNPINDQSFFVRQHYLDFLSREPDQSGWDFWTHNITQCGTDAGCIDRMRVETSKAFFLSIEFQQTGYYVHRFFRASYGRVPSILEFFPEKQLVSNGVVVGASGWEQLLESNKQTYATNWVQRTQFKAVYDPLNNTQYVDRLFSNAQVTPDAAFRSDLITGLDNGIYSRATALRRIVEYQPFVSHEFNPAFVLMQYFGYLRRNPQDPPDNNLDGYNFWLGELNMFNDQNNMVRAFILSTEYRGRFGTP